MALDTDGVGGPDRDRTGDLMNAIHARSQLRYWPTFGEENPNSSMQGYSGGVSAFPRNRQIRFQESRCSGVFSGSHVRMLTRRSNVWPPIGLS
jgi:hypothetical protein